MIFNLENRPTPECHASTIAEASGGLVAAWFGGLTEKDSSVGIWLSRHLDGNWQPPREVANGNQPDGSRHACWNPVLFQPSQGPLLLFYKVGATIAGWQTWMMQSEDGGDSWSEPSQLPNAIMGPVKNKPIELEDGTLLFGGSDEPDWQQWQVYFSRCKDHQWQLIGPCNSTDQYQAIQPAFLHQQGNIIALCRTRQGHISRLSSSDGGQSWSEMTPTVLPNPNSGIDAVTTRRGRHYVVYNPVTKGRSPLAVAMSEDTEYWQDIAVLESEPGEYSYPAIIEDGEGQLQITYTWRRQLIKHVTIQP